MLDSIKNEDIGKLILRLTLAILIILHGISKLLHPQSLDFISGTLSHIGLPDFIAYGVYLGEVVAPLMILIGFYTRIGAAIVTINMLFVIGLVHMSQLFLLTENGGFQLELQYFYLFTAVAVIFLGSGKHAYRPD